PGLVVVLVSPPVVLSPLLSSSSVGSSPDSPLSPSSSFSSESFLSSSSSAELELESKGSEEGLPQAGSETSPRDRRDAIFILWVMDEKHRTMRAREARTEKTSASARAVGSSVDGDRN